MNLLVKRVDLTNERTIGQLFVDGVFECWTLEDTVRTPGVKIQNQTAIPAGTYRVTWRWSDHFGKDMLHVEDVPGFAGIEIHGGNDAADTDGCLLVGRDRLGHDEIANCAPAKEALEAKVCPVLDAGTPVWITYQNDPEWSAA